MATALAELPHLEQALSALPTAADRNGASLCIRMRRPPPHVGAAWGSTMPIIIPAGASAGIG